jgi:hypothetical protein
VRFVKRVESDRSPGSLFGLLLAVRGEGSAAEGNLTARIKGSGVLRKAAANRPGEMSSAAEVTGERGRLRLRTLKNKEWRRAPFRLECANEPKYGFRLPSCRISRKIREAVRYDVLLNIRLCANIHLVHSTFNGDSPSH